MSRRHAFRRAQSFANESGKCAFVVYDSCARHYQALHTLPVDDDVEMMTLHVIDTVLPQKDGR